MQDLRLALVQTDLFWQNPAQNRGHFEELMQEAAGKADLIVLPEMFSTGFSMDTACAEIHNTATCKWLQMNAERLKACITGSVMTNDKGQLYNRMYVARPGQPLIWYNKRHLFRMAREHEHYSAGNERLIFDYNGWKICPLVCYDLRFPVFSRNTPLLYDLVLYIASWPAKRALAWNTLLPARAVENIAYCAGVNRIGIDGNGHAYLGDSQAIGFDGHSLIHLQSENKIGFSTLSYEALTAYRQNFPAWEDADAFTIL
jgi:predicted amidohydrolase